MVFPVLPEHEVHVWSLQTDRPPSEVETWAQFLSADERRAVERLHLSADRQRHVLSQALRRGVLAGYAQTDLSQLQFKVDHYGKPAVAGPDEVLSLCFNVAHAGNCVVLAVARDRLVGIDVELMEEDSVDLAMAERFFSPKEWREWQDFPAEQKRLAFYRGWTRKEAYLKATGQGLHLDLNRFSVSLAAHSPALLEHEVDHAETTRWKFCDLDLKENYAACLVAERMDWLERVFVVGGASL